MSDGRSMVPKSEDSRSMKLPREFYVENDALTGAQALIGKLLVTEFDGIRTTGLINEAEAYMGKTDRASHAFNGRRTKRNGSMYAIGGTTYVYLCYGIHHLFNVVFNEVDIPHAVLIRSIRPVEGIERMKQRRPTARTSTAGPGTLTQALGIRTDHDAEDLTGQRIWIEDLGLIVPDREVQVGPRIGVDYAGDDARLPYRFLFSPSRPERP